MRSTTTLSMEDGSSHNGLHECCRGRAQAGDDEPDTRKNGKVRGGLCCSSGFGYSPDGSGGDSSSSSTKQARPRHSEMVTRQELETSA
jgi:hypothetical protein